MILGDRYQSFYYPEVARASARRVDAASSNLSTSWNDSAFARFCLDPLAGFQPHLALREWDRKRGSVKPASPHPLADLYVCWRPEALYLGLYAQDVVEAESYRDGRVPETDRAEWTVRPGKAAPTIRARIGAGGPAVVSGGAVRIVHRSGVQLNTRCIAAMALPASLFGRPTLRPGDRLEFASTFHTQGRAYRTDWRGRFTLRESHGMPRGRQ